ncbi:MAG: hypothetical protein JXA54_14410 [Candidatus Heimdallarchaeota archaeon]|nr:hypothetical protein [Candidatus Heimdallarchaeota archaeon]
MFERKQFTVLLFCAFVVSMPYVQAFSTAAPGRYVIYLEEDQSITQTLVTMKEQMPDISSIAYGSVKYQLLVHRITEPLVWVGHGDKEGINTAQGKLSWGRFAQEVKRSPMMDIVLSCYSSELLEQKVLTGQDAITFTGEIDATLGGLVATWLLTGETTVLQHAIERSLSLHCGKVAYDPLHELDPGEPGGDPTISQMLQQIADLPTNYYDLEGSQQYFIHNLSGVELCFHIASLVLLVIEIALVLSIGLEEFSFIAAGMIDFYTTGIVSFLMAIASYYTGIITEAEVIDEIVGSITTIGECLVKAFQSSPTWEKILFGALVGINVLFLLIEFFTDAFTGGLATAARVIISITLITLFVYDFVYDLCDDNCIIG